MSAVGVLPKEVIDFAVAAMGNPKSKPRTNRERLCAALEALAKAGWRLAPDETKIR